MLPVILMALVTILEFFITDEMRDQSIFLETIFFLGNSTTAMLVSMLFALYTMGYARGKKMDELMKTCGAGIAGIAGLLLIIGGGGAFKQVLIDSGAGAYIADLVSGEHINPIILAWAIASLLRICLGSATVAAISTAGLVIPMISGNAEVNLALITLATGAGSSICSHVNDASFWMIKEFFGLTTKETLCTWTLMSTVVSVLGLVFLLLVDMAI